MGEEEEEDIFGLSLQCLMIMLKGDEASVSVCLERKERKPREGMGGRDGRTDKLWGRNLASRLKSLCWGGVPLT